MLQQEPEHPCRVCLAEGARNIFNTSTINDEMCTIASINHIRHKLQYVTQLQVNEDDGLPFWICELCVIQLNVAYRFKVLASESDNVLRQRLKDKEASSNIPNPLALRERHSFPVVRRAIKQEPVNGIVLSPVTKKHSNPSPTFIVSREAANELISSVSSDGENIPAMVCLQKDIFNPAEDEAFLQDIVKSEGISIPRELERMYSVAHKLTTSSTKSSPIPSEDGRETPKSSSPMPPVTKKRKTSITEHRRTFSSETLKSKAKQPTVAKDRQSAPRKNTKPRSNAALMRHRLKKELVKLRIDMVDDKLIDRCALTSSVGPKKIMKRRNSVCVSSFAQFL